MAKKSKGTVRRRRMKPHRLLLEHVGPIGKADVELGDLTVLVGPQASGKSVFLQTLGLVVDWPAIRRELARVNIDWRGNPSTFFSLYFGEGLGDLWNESSAMEVDGSPQDLAALARPAKGRPLKQGQRLFYIPAQRVMSLRDGLTRPFMDFRSGEPYALRAFGERLHWLLQNEFAQERTLFPHAKRMGPELTSKVLDKIYGGLELRIDDAAPQKRIVLAIDEETVLPVPVWSAGQREFTPLLLGLYWLMPPGRASRRDDVEWVVIEEPEMGLHPGGVVLVMGLVLELLHRGYRVCLSTHSTDVLDVLWGLRVIQEQGGTPRDVKRMLELESAGVAALALSATRKQYRVYCFERHQEVRDISSLDPGSDEAWVSEWGGLASFASKVGNVVSDVVLRAEKHR